MVPPHRRKICPVLERPFSMTGVKRKYKREKSWERRGIRQGYVAADEKPAHVITFPVTTRCREQFILLSIPFFIRAPPFCSLHLSSSSRIFLFLIVLGFFKSFVFLFFLRSFVSKQLILDRRLFCTFPFYLIVFILLFLMSSLA